MRVSLVLAVAGSVALAGSAWAVMPLSPQQTVDARIEGMKTLGGNLKAASQAATPAEAKVKLAEAIEFSKNTVTWFPKGTGPGDAGVTKTRALPDIWTKPAEFKAAAEALTAALNNVDAALDGGEKGKIDAAFAEVGKNCGGCHKPFRGPEIPS